MQNILHDNYNIETSEQINMRTTNIIEKIKNSEANTILIVTHYGVINSFIYNLFNVFEIPINTIYSKNCTITYITYNNNKFELITSPNSLHFDIYNKNYN